MNNDKENKGYIHIYTGNGKGKTTAAFGLALRAACSGKSVYIGQFVKDMKYNETKIVEYIDNISIEQLGDGCFIFNEPTKESIRLAQEGLKKCADYIINGKYDLIILDELCIAIHFKLIDSKQVIDILKKRNPLCEIVITGRYAQKNLIDCADLVTEMKEIKHYFHKGILSRNGIDK
ncbi:MAG: cob(I)yrinic acid a,c-diamide adenosyltransferase [Marinifilaceae bacterium]|jgi:cob(I)alamin adenosyltransferase|nr:cob(I)yrinic acid a,c-diamide adenosyltransferase [Marinifilaceae bacterium]